MTGVGTPQARPTGLTTPRQAPASGPGLAPARPGRETPGVAGRRPVYGQTVARPGLVFDDVTVVAVHGGRGLGTGRRVALAPDIRYRGPCQVRRRRFLAPDGPGVAEGRLLGVAKEALVPRAVETRFLAAYQIPVEGGATGRGRPRLVWAAETPKTPGRPLLGAPHARVYNCV